MDICGHVNQPSELQRQENGLELLYPQWFRLRARETEVQVAGSAAGRKRKYLNVVTFAAVGLSLDKDHRIQKFMARNIMEIQAPTWPSVNGQAESDRHWEARDVLLY